MAVKPQRSDPGVAVLAARRAGGMDETLIVPACSVGDVELADRRLDAAQPLAPTHAGAAARGWRAGGGSSRPGRVPTAP